MCENVFTNGSFGMKLSVANGCFGMKLSVAKCLKYFIEINFRCYPFMCQ